MATAYDYASYGAFKRQAAITRSSIARRAYTALGLRNRYLRFLDGLPSSARIVEVGCGDGSFVRTLRAAGFADTVGVDCSPSYAASDVIVADAAEYLDGERDGSLGAVIAFDVLEHLTVEDGQRLLKVAARKLAPTGRIVIRLPNAGSPLALFNQYGDLSHRSAMTEVSLGQMAFDAGLDAKCFAEPLSYPRSLTGLTGVIMWPIYAGVLRSALAAFGQRPRVITPNLVCQMTHRTCA